MIFSRTIFFFYCRMLNNASNKTTPLTSTKIILKIRTMQLNAKNRKLKQFMYFVIRQSHTNGQWQQYLGALMEDPKLLLRTAISNFKPLILIQQRNPTSLMLVRILMRQTYMFLEFCFLQWFPIYAYSVQFILLITFIYDYSLRWSYRARSHFTTSALLGECWI